MRDAGAKRERQVEDDLARVVELSTDAPPPRDEKLAADRPGGLAPDPELRIALEAVFLPVRLPVEYQPEEIENHQRHTLESGERRGFVHDPKSG